MEMTDHTLNLIYAIKKSDKSWDQAVSEYMSAYSGSPIERYDEYSLNHILRGAYCDFISTCDNPAMEVYNLLEMMDSYPMYSRAHHLANCMGLAQVKDKGRFVNGFRDVIMADTNNPTITFTNKQTDESFDVKAIKYTPDKDGWRAGAHIENISAELEELTK